MLVPWILDDPSDKGFRYSRTVYFEERYYYGILIVIVI